ncbi:MAG TPA: hemolysin family protein, partial [Caulobacteraceae bacterium]|nr:hemolysin family protein [Caulobacteraceae bacterium]
MSSADDPLSDASPTLQPSLSRGVRAMLRRWRRGKAKPDGAAPDAGDAPAAPLSSVDIVDQAQAFKTLRVSEVMTPRADIMAVEISSPFEAVVRQFVEVEHSRMPVYRETLDDPVGVVHIKDVFKLLAEDGGGPAAKDPVLHRLRRDVLYVPGSMRAADLLVRMQGSRIHLALVIDEFGGTDGLVTLEDLVEAVVGDIADEYDEAGPVQIDVRPGGVFEADARASLEALEEAMGRPMTPEDLADEDIDTVGGLVSALAGRVPQRGEIIAHPDGLEFEVTDADPRRIKRVRVRPTTIIPPVG